MSNNIKTAFGNNIIPTDISLYKSACAKCDSKVKYLILINFAFYINYHISYNILTVEVKNIIYQSIF